MEKDIYTFVDYLPDDLNLAKLKTTTLKERFIAVLGEEEFNRLSNKELTKEELLSLAKKLNIKLPSSDMTINPVIYAEDLENKK